MTRYTPSSQAGVVYFLLDLAWRLFVVVAAASTIWVVVGLIRGGNTSVLGGDSLQIEAQLVRDDVSLPDRVSLDDDAHVLVSVTEPTTEQIVLTSAILLSKAIIVTFVLWFLRGIARSAKEGDPFGRENVLRLRGLGFTLAFGGSALALVTSWARDELVQSLPRALLNHVTTLGFVFPLDFMLAGMAAFILAAVFDYGVALREDVEATV